MPVLTTAFAALLVGMSLSNSGEVRAAMDTGDPAAPLPTAHAHNDYQHADPCVGAIALGFRSLEVDVHPVGDDLLVGHDPEDLVPERTIERLYLEPLRAWCDATAATDATEAEPPLTLLVDIKRHPARTLELLLAKLEPLRPLLSHVADGAMVPGRLTVILSGSRPIAEVAAMENRVVFIDGRPTDLDRNPPVTLMPLISGSYGLTLRTPLIGPLTDEASARLHALVEKTHAQGRRLRFWGHLEDPQIWSTLVDAGVDLIGTDDRPQLAAWLRANDPRCGSGAADAEHPITSENEPSTTPAADATPE